MLDKLLTDSYSANRKRYAHPRLVLDAYSPTPLAHIQPHAQAHVDSIGVCDALGYTHDSSLDVLPVRGC
jgi:hypothetical protein